MMGTGPPPGFDPDDVTPPPLAERLWPVTSLALDVSGQCNLACRYCAENATQPRRFPMSTKTLEAAWAFLFPNGQLRNGASIRLGSGEPLLNFPLLLRLASLMEEASQSGGGKAAFCFPNHERHTHRRRDQRLARGFGLARQNQLGWSRVRARLLAGEAGWAGYFRRRILCGGVACRPDARAT